MSSSDLRSSVTSVRRWLRGAAPGPAVAQIVLYVGIVVTSAVVAVGANARAEPHGSPSVLLTADGEGHVGPCSTCPLHVGLGGLARRATVIARERQAAPVLLLDAGNAFFGGDSAPSGGQVIAAAYDALEYDAVNISYRDFRHGRDATLALLGAAKFAPLSANLTDAATGKLLFKPFVVKNMGGRKVVILGLTESPEGLDLLPHLREQLAGISIRPPPDALAEWLPRAKSESDEVFLLYYGSPAGLAPIRHDHSKDLSLILVGGTRPEELPAADGPTVVASEQHGKTIARRRPDSSAIEQIPVAPSVAPDATMQKLLAVYSPPAPKDPVPAATGVRTAGG